MFLDKTGPFEVLIASQSTTNGPFLTGGYVVTEPKAHILVIEDDIDIQDLMTAFFKPKGYQLTLFSDAEAALEQVGKGLICDVVVADFNLPGMSGMSLITELKKIWSNTPIILMTGTASCELAVEAVQTGAYDFVVKPLHFAQLIVSIERALHLNRLNKNYDNLKVFVRENDRQFVKGIIGRSPPFLAALDIAKRVAKSSTNIFISGESGAGKEIVAKFIHNESRRHDRPFIAINCSAIPENLLESELFGHAKGAFTGAIDKRLGLFEEAESGTLFLDEIGDLSLSLQVKLLRVLQDRKIKRVGENRTRDIDVRIISATHKDLREEVAQGRFREDLFFRLNVIPIKLPPLRERKEDILPLAEYFLSKYAVLNESPARKFSKEAVQHLLQNYWRGNVRELENTIERAAVLADGELIDLNDLDSMESRIPMANKTPEGFSEGDFHITLDGSLLPLQEVTQKYIEFAVNRNGGAKDKTARDLQIDRKTLYRRITERAMYAPRVNQ